MDIGDREVARRHGWSEGRMKGVRQGGGRVRETEGEGGGAARVRGGRRKERR